MKAAVLWGLYADRKRLSPLPTHKRARHEFDLAQEDLNGAVDGDLVTAELLPSQGLTRKKVRVREVVGRQDDPRAISLISPA